MFVTRWTYLPTLAGYTEYVDLLKGWVNTRQAAGQAMGLLRDAAPAEGFRLQTISYYEKLATLGSQRARPVGDTTIQDWINSAAPLSRSIWQMEMFEVIVPVQELSKQGEYSIRFRSYPATGREQDVRAITADIVNRLQSRGFNVGATWRYFAREGAIAEWEFPVKQLGDWEELSKKIFSDPEVQVFGRNAAFLSRKPSSTDAWEVLIAAPTAK